MVSVGQSSELENFVSKFFGAFDNRNGRVPTHEQIGDHFLESATILNRAGGETKVLTVAEFVEPRVALLTSGRLREFSEWEVASSTQIFGTFAIRSSEYEKSGEMDGSAYGGQGTKLFQLAYIDNRWRIVSLCWFDREA